MYKVFIYDKPVYLTSDKKYAVKNCQQFVGLDVNKVLTSLKSAAVEGAVVYSSEIDFLWGDFRKHFKSVIAGGGLVKNENDEILLIFRLGKWDLPKGKLEKGEEIKSCAIREVEEECAIKGLQILSPLPNSYHCYQIKNKWHLKTTFWFQMSTDYKGELVPQTEEGIEVVKWIKKSELKEIFTNTYLSIKEVLNSAGYYEN